jgi:hypothetical protein
MVTVSQYTSIVLQISRARDCLLEILQAEAMAGEHFHDGVKALVHVRPAHVLGGIRVEVSSLRATGVGLCG